MFYSKEILDNAIQYCSSVAKQRMTCKEILNCLRHNNPIVHSRFRHSVAASVSDYLYGKYGHVILDIRLYGSAMNFNAGKYSDIDLIVHVKKGGNIIANDIRQIDRLLICEYYRLIDENADSYGYMIDLHVVDDSSKERHNSSYSYLEHIKKNESMAI